jgi:hypothetical protein
MKNQAPLHARKYFIFKSAIVIFLTGLFLEFLPRSLFKGFIQDKLFEKILATSKIFQNTFAKVEAIYSGYGQKFVLSQCVIFIVFLFVTMFLIFRIKTSDLSLQPESIGSSGKGSRMLLLVLVFLGLFAFQFFCFFYLFDSRGTRYGTMPMTYGSLIWSLMAAIAGTFTAMVKKSVK